MIRPDRVIFIFSQSRCLVIPGISGKIIFNSFPFLSLML